MVFCCFSWMENIAALSSSSDISVKSIICWGVLEFGSLDKSMPISLE